MKLPHAPVEEGLLVGISVSNRKDLKFSYIIERALLYPTVAIVICQQE